MIVDSKVSSKGQVVLPKAMRVRQGMDDGTPVEIVEQAGGVLVRPKVSIPDGPGAHAVLAAIRARNPYRGPPLTDADIDAGIAREVARKFTL